MHPASSASNFKWELKNTLSFWYFCQCNLNPFTDLRGGGGNVITKQTNNNKKKHPDLPYNYCTTEGEGENTTNNSPDISKAGKETHLTCWSKEHTWKLQSYSLMLGLPVLSECRAWFSTSSSHHRAVSRAGEAAQLTLGGIAAPATSCEGTLGWFWLQ